MALITTMIGRTLMMFGVGDRDSVCVVADNIVFIIRLYDVDGSNDDEVFVVVFKVW